MKFTGKAEEIAESLVNLFKNGDPGQAMSNMFLKGSGTHCDGYSWNNKMLVYLHGYSDAMGFNGWKSKERTVKKGEKAFYILAPLACSGKKKVNGVDTKYTFIRGFRGIPIFGFEQTEGEPIASYEQDKEHLECLPLLEVAELWGIEVGSYRGQDHGPSGYFVPNPENLKIMLGVKNVSTWLHELVHASEQNLGVLTSTNYKEQKVESEIVAELGATVLAHAIGLHDQADNGGCWEYISHYAKQKNVEPAEAAYKLINRTCQAVNNILTAKFYVESYNELAMI